MHCAGQAILPPTPLRTGSVPAASILSNESGRWSADAIAAGLDDPVPMRCAAPYHRAVYLDKPVRMADRQRAKWPPGLQFRFLVRSGRGKVGRPIDLASSGSDRGRPTYRLQFGDRRFDLRQQRQRRRRRGTIRYTRRRIGVDERGFHNNLRGSAPGIQEDGKAPIAPLSTSETPADREHEEPSTTPAAISLCRRSVARVSQQRLRSLGTRAGCGRRTQSRRNISI